VSLINLCFLNPQNQCWVCQQDAVVKCNRFSKFPFNRAFQIIQCCIDQLLMDFTILPIHQNILYMSHLLFIILCSVVLLLTVFFLCSLKVNSLLACSFWLAAGLMSWLQCLVILLPTVACCILNNILLIQKVCCIGLHGGHLLAGFLNYILAQISRAHDMPLGHFFNIFVV